MTRLTAWSATLATFALALSLVGCSESEVEAPTPPAPGIDSPEGASAPEHLEGQTLWSVAETGQTLADDDPAVQAVRTLVTVHSGAIDNRGPDGLDESIDEEFSLYTEDFAGTLDGVGWVDAARERATVDGVVTEQRGLGWMQSTIAEDRASATAQYETHIVFTQAADAFLQENGIELGAEYVMLREVAVVGVDGEWFISDVRESGLQPRTAQP